jgi:hypothetical protein
MIVLSEQKAIIQDENSHTTLERKTVYVATKAIGLTGGLKQH